MWKAIASRISRSHSSRVAPVATQPRPVRRVHRVVGVVAAFDHDEIAPLGHPSCSASPACLAMLAQIFGCSVLEGLRAFVTSPARSACRYWRLLPRVRASSHPAASIRLMASLTLTGTPARYDALGISSLLRASWSTYPPETRRPPATVERSREPDPRSGAARRPRHATASHKSTCIVRPPHEARTPPRRPSPLANPAHAQSSRLLIFIRSTSLEARTPPCPTHRIHRALPSGSHPPRLPPPRLRPRSITPGLPCRFLGQVDEGGPARQRWTPFLERPGVKRNLSRRRGGGLAVS
jgi:hypothetical protein